MDVYTVQKTKFSIKDFFIKCDEIPRKQCFSSFSYFADLFHEPLHVSEITAKYEKRGKYWPYCTN